jgi:hypothetical protein
MTLTGVPAYCCALEGTPAALSPAARVARPAQAGPTPVINLPFRGASRLEAVCLSRGIQAGMTSPRSR